MWTTFKNYFKKKVNVDLDKGPQKSLAATMLIEIEALSKMRLFEQIEKGHQNIPHIHGTKYKFEEIGGFRSKHKVWAIYIRSRNMCSVEAETCLDTSKNILEDMASLVIPESCIDKLIQKIFFPLKG